MDFRLTEEQELLKQSVIEFAQNEIQPGAAERDEEARFDRDVWDKAAEMGLMGMPFPEEYGGEGAGVIDTCIVGEALAYGGNDVGFDLSWGAHIAIGGVPIWQVGTEEQKKKYLPKIASGETIAGFGLTEPGAGSDSAGIISTAEKKDGYYVLNGVKTFITNGPVGDIFIVLAKTDKEKGAKGISGFIIEKDFPGFSIGNEIHKMGNRSSPTSDLIMDNCEVPEENLLGVENMGFFQVGMATLGWERTIMLATTLGIMEYELDVCVTYSKQREQFGKPICRFQSVANMLADMKMNAELSRWILMKAAWNKEVGIDDMALSSICKLQISEASVRSAAMAVQIHGGYGYTKEYDVERLFRDNVLGTLGGGTSEIQRHIIAQSLIR